MKKDQFVMIAMVLNGKTYIYFFNFDCFKMSCNIFLRSFDYDCTHIEGCHLNLMTIFFVIIFKSLTCLIIGCTLVAQGRKCLQGNNVFFSNLVTFGGTYFNSKSNVVL